MNLVNDQPPRPDLDDIADLAARFRLALVPIVRQLRTQVEGDMTPSLTSALATVARVGPVTLGDLAEAEKVSPPMATKQGQRLEERGLVRVVPCPDDGRVRRLELTPAGDELLERSRRRRNAWLAERFAEVGPDERAALAAVVPVLEAIGRAPRASP
jgi:DNA-binding MarR family transcriptional regulator